MTISELLYLNGKLIKSQEARISVFDFGFLFAGGVYEVILINNGKPYRLAEHLQRLQVSADLIGLTISVEALGEACRELIAANQEIEGKMYIQVTYGNCGERVMCVPSGLEPTVLITTGSSTRAPAGHFLNGISIKAAPDTRWVHCNIKSIALLPNLLELNKAAKDGFEEVVFYEKQTGYVTECASSNIFCISGGALYTPPESNKILSGITRSVVLELAREGGLKVFEEHFTYDFLLEVEEAFISSTTREIVPVKSIDRKVISQAPGHITRELILLLIEDLEKHTGGVHWKRDVLQLEP